PSAQTLPQPVPANRPLDQARVDLAQPLVVRAQPLVNAETKRTEKNIRVFDQPMKDRLAFRLLQIDGNAPLVPVRMIPSICPQLVFVRLLIGGEIFSREGRR